MKSVIPDLVSLNYWENESIALLLLLLPAQGTPPDLPWKEGVLAAGTQDQLRAGAAEGGAFPTVTLGHALGHHEVAMARAVPQPTGDTSR